MSHLISLSKSVIKLLFRQLMTPQTLRFFLDQPLKAMADKEKKMGRRKS